MPASLRRDDTPTRGTPCAGESSSTCPSRSSAAPLSGPASGCTVVLQDAGFAASCVFVPNPPKSSSISVSSPRESSALLIPVGLPWGSLPAAPDRLSPPTFSTDCPTLARFCFFQSSNERKFALSSGESVSISWWYCPSGAAEATSPVLVADADAVVVVIIVSVAIIAPGSSSWWLRPPPHRSSTHIGHSICTVSAPPLSPAGHIDCDDPSSPTALLIKVGKVKMAQDTHLAVNILQLLPAHASALLE